jgi:hypothetical protein
LAEARILHFAICHEPRINLWQGLASPATLRCSSQDRNDTIYKKAIAGFGIPPHKSCLLARGHELDTSRLARRSMRRDTKKGPLPLKREATAGILVEGVEWEVSQFVLPVDGSREWSVAVIMQDMSDEPAPLFGAFRKLPMAGDGLRHGVGEARAHLPF